MPERDLEDAAGASGNGRQERAAAGFASDPKPLDYRRGPPEVQAAYRAGYRCASEEFRRSTSWRVTAPLRWLRVSTKPATARKPEPDEEPHPVDLIRQAAPRDTSHLEWTWRVKGLDREPDTFALYRIVGNDLYPRHRKGQAQQNVRFILENEPPLADCEKRWVLNRIVDPEQEQAIVGLLEDHGQDWVRIPFIEEEYRAIGWDTSGLPEPAFLAVADLDEAQTRRVLAMAHRLKNNYAMNNNGARNVALRDGRSRAKWVLPWDGNCFLTRRAWEALRAGVAEKPWLTHFVVPMARVTDNDELLRDDFEPDPVEEPQLVFRRDAREEFDEEFCYGRRSKIELFWRLGIPGAWDRWRDDEWDLPRSQVCEEAFGFDVAGWVARLFSGSAHLEEATVTGRQQRWLVREATIMRTLGALDQKIAGVGDGEFGRACSCYDPRDLDALAAASSRGDGSAAARIARVVVDDAEQSLEDAPSCDRYDRSRLQHLFGGTTALGLAWRLTGRAEFAETAARSLRAWFVDPATRMAPHLDEGRVGGIIEFKDIHYVLDTVRILEASGGLADEVRVGLRAWLEGYLEWLLTSEQGRTERAAADNRGIYYDLQVAGIASYLGRREEVVETVIRAQSRLTQHFLPGGFQPAEMRGSATAHHCHFNLQGWLCFVRLARSHAVLVTDWNRWPWNLLREAIVSTLSQDASNWPYPQVDPFDIERPIVLRAMARELGVLKGARWEPSPSERDVKSTFSPHDGIPPYWNVGIAART